MRISTRMTLALAATGLAVFSLYGKYHLDVELAVRRQSIERHTSLLGGALQAAIEDSLRDRQIEDIHDTLVTLRGVDPTVDIIVWGSTGQVFASSDGGSSSDPLETRVREEVQRTRRAVLRYDAPGEATRLTLGLPLSAPAGRSTGTLLLSRPLAALQQDLQSARQQIVLSVLFLVVATTVLGLILGKFYIERPLADLAGAMRRVRSGDLSSALEMRSSDEVRALAGEFNAMVGELRLARRRLEEEAEQRERIERGLQEAGKLITIGQLSAGLAHEIGSPLQILNGRARALLGKANDPEAVKRNAEILVSQTDRITRIIEQLLQFARRRPARIGRLELTSTVGAVVRLLDIEARRRRVTLAFSADGDTPAITADADQVQQIVLNLVANALVATHPGGEVSVRLEPGTLRSADDREMPGVKLIVSDTGVGIAPEVLPRLGEPFFTTRATQGGTGLGLAVTRSIIHEHRGTLSIDSELGRGSRFTVCLPVESLNEKQERTA